MTKQTNPVKEKFPPGIRLISWATGIRWAGWGFSEAIIPVFIFSFAGSYAASGLLRSAYDIVFILMMPIVGSLSDRISARIIILIGLSIYPFISLSYFLAGVFGMIGFVILARALNGISFAFDSVGRKTYFMRFCQPQKISTAFGHFDSISHFLLILAMLTSTLFVAKIELHWLFLAIIPTNIVTMLMIARLKQHRNEQDWKHQFSHINPLRAFAQVFHELKSWGRALKITALTTFFLGIIRTMANFFVPILAFTQGVSLPKVVLISVLLLTPRVFGEAIGKFADKKRVGALVIALKMTILLLIALAAFNNFTFQLIMALGAGIIAELVTLTDNGIVMRLGSKSHFGRINSNLGLIANLGTLTGPIVLGLSIDRFGFTATLLSLALLSLILLLVVFTNREYFSKKPVIT